jgi:hypothetical protein
MQLAKPIVLTIASLTLLATPVLAKNAKAPKADPGETIADLLRVSGRR